MRMVFLITSSGGKHCALFIFKTGHMIPRLTEIGKSLNFLKVILVYLNSKHTFIYAIQ